MVVRQERKRKKYLGNRTRGAGDTKNRRGKGSHGGRGRAGKWGHKKMSFFDEIGTKKTQKPNSVQKAITLLDLNEYVSNLIALNKSKGEIVLDFENDLKLKKYQKIVAKGKFEHKVKIVGAKYSAKVEEIIKKNGGSFE